MIALFYRWLLPIQSIYFDPGWFTPAWKWYGGFSPNYVFRNWEANLASR
jgi:hypothetical protein